MADPSQLTADSRIPIFQGYDTFIVERENLGYSGEATINYPWLIALSSKMGNAYTSALARTANVFSEPEWGFESRGVNQNWVGAGSRAVGGITIWW